MVDSELFCNFRSCRRPLRDVAWVTFCSHIFCDVHGQPLTQVPVECSACGANLAVEIDVRRVNVNPSERFKSMALAGLKPTLVMEVCHRALTFWGYQREQERGYQIHIISKLRERLRQVEAYYEQVVRTRDEHLASVRRQLHDTRVEHEKCQQEKRSISELLNEKTHQYQKLQDLHRPSEATQKQLSHHPSGRPALTRGAPYHFPVHMSQLTSRHPGHSYPHQRDLDTQATHGIHRIEVGRYQNPAPQECRKGGPCQDHAPKPTPVRPKELRSFMIATPRRSSSDDFTFRPAIFTDRGGNDQTGNDNISRNDHRHPV
ncbi:E3 ubiquitin-protein ligase CCNB1IP1-like isoform X2 [Panulirus ornatus]|uniref:E3 ubiquitin-protein ligase CCNB1IP1-like isoform X2 n=1 Tax=Panulirus ornatus TaxID=150431 RepID=UPI003A8C0B35